MMGRWITQAGRELLAEADALVPVPLHWRRLWARRFNQSAMLAAGYRGKPACQSPLAH
jgi:predicted amidophosphoribosyltransferase